MVCYGMTREWGVVKKMSSPEKEKMSDSIININEITIISLNYVGTV